LIHFYKRKSAKITRENVDRKSLKIFCGFVK